MEEVAAVEGEVGVALQGHPEDHSQADDLLVTKVIGAEFTAIIETVLLI